MCISFRCCCVGVQYSIAWVCNTSMIPSSNQVFLAVLTRPRGGTDLYPPLARSPCLVPWHLHLWISYKVGALLCALVMYMSENMLGPVCVCVCFLPIYSGRQVRWMYQPGSHRRKITQDFSSTFLLRCMPLFFSREGFTVPFPRRL